MKKKFLSYYFLVIGIFTIFVFKREMLWLRIIYGMQLYLKKPAGVKPLYSKQMVDLSMELHIPPQYLREKMFKLRSLDEPRIEKLWNTYGKNPQKLSRGIKKLRQMKGFSNADEFYEGARNISVLLTKGQNLNR